MLFCFVVLLLVAPKNVSQREDELVLWGRHLCCYYYSSRYLISAKGGKVV